MTLDELRQLDPRDPGRWPLPVRLGAIALCFVVATGVLFYLLIATRSVRTDVTYSACSNSGDLIL